MDPVLTGCQDPSTYVTDSGEIYEPLNFADALASRIPEYQS